METQFPTCGLALGSQQVFQILRCVLATAPDVRPEQPSFQLAHSEVSILLLVGHCSKRHRHLPSCSILHGPIVFHLDSDPLADCQFAQRLLALPAVWLSLGLFALLTLASTAHAWRFDAGEEDAQGLQVGFPLDRQGIAGVHLYDSSAEIFHRRLILLQSACVEVFPHAFSFGLTNHLRLLEFSVVFCIEVAVFGRAKLAEAPLQHFGRNVASAEMDAAYQGAIVVDTC